MTTAKESRSASLGIFDANFVIGNMLSFLCVFVVYYLESLLIEMDFYEIGLESVQ